MALNKRKILDAAQKHLQKGNLDKALKEYQKVVDADPRDNNVRLKVGDVQLRLGKTDEAISAYLDVAQQFMKDGFDAKAVALFKQIIKIDEKRYDVYEPLSELYQRLGLSSEAMAALQTAADAHQREGRKKEGLALLRKMASLDPSNTATRLKIAEMLWKEELGEEALTEYEEVVAELERQADHEGVIRVHEQVLRHVPDRIQNLVGLGNAQLELGRPEKADAPLLKATEVEVDSVEAWEAMARVHEVMGRRKEHQDAWKTVAAIYKDRGNEERAKEILQLYVAAEGIGENEDGEIVSEDLGGTTIGELGADPEDELSMGVEAAPVEAVPAAEAPAEEAEVDLDEEIEIELDEEVAEADAKPKGEPAPPADADPSQLLAEAGVYLRYSQHEKAVACLERILEAEPGHLEAIEKLGEARIAMDDKEGAVALWKEGAGHAQQAGNQEVFDLLCERIRDLDEHAADGLAADALAPTLGEPESDSGEDLDLDLAFETPSGEPELTGESSGLDIDIDLLSDSLVAGVPSRKQQATAPEPVLDGAAVAESVEEAEEQSSDLSAQFDVPAGGVRIDGSDSGELSAEDLEEAEFYFRQGLLDEAETILKRLLEASPGHPQVLLRLGEISKARGDCPSTPVEKGVDFDRTEEDTNPGEVTDDTVEDPEGAPSVGDPPAGPDDVTVQVDPDDIDDVDVHFDDDEGGTTLGSETAPSLQAVVDDDEAMAEGEGFDLAAELEDVFDDAKASGMTGEDSIAGTTQAGFQSIFQSFKQGVKETLGEGEYETHYDLGIAYREMGLFDDAIGEFTAAMPSPTRKLDCLAMMGICALDLANDDDAVAYLEQALSMPDLSEERMTGLRFDLGRAFERKGELERARELWQQVQAAEPDFRGVGERLERLGEEESSPGLGEAEPRGMAEVFENFDDLIAEAEAGFDADEGGKDDDSDDGPDGSDPGDSAGGGATRWGRKVSYG